MKTEILHLIFLWENIKSEKNGFLEWEVPKTGAFGNLCDSETQYIKKDF